MGIVKKIFFLPSAINLLVGLGLVIGAYLFQLIGYYDPCPLCILQRWAFGFIAVCGLVLLIPNLYPLINKIILFIASLLSLGGGNDSWEDRSICSICQLIKYRHVRLPWIF